MIFLKKMKMVANFKKKLFTIKYFYGNIKKILLIVLEDKKFATIFKLLQTVFLIINIFKYVHIILRHLF